MTKKKLNKLLHKWLSIPLGIIISMLCFTGAALVFQQEMLEASNPSHYFVNEVKENVIPLDELIPMVNAELVDNSVANVKVSDDPHRTYRMGLAEGFRVSVFVNQYTGQIVGQYAVKESGFFTIMQLHRWLLDSTRTWGKWIVGWSTILFIVIIITGLCYLNKRSKENYVIHFNGGTKRLMFGLHNALGVYAALVLIICSLSGLMWSFDWFRNSVFSICGAEELPVQDNSRSSRSDKKERSEVNIIHWQTALESTLTPELNYNSVQISDGMVSAHPKNTYRTRVQDKFVFNKKTGEITKFTPFGEEDVRTRVWAWAYSLHVGDYWGMWSKIFTFIFCIIGGSIPLTGYYFTIKKWVSKRKRRQKAINV